MAKVHNVSPTSVDLYPSQSKSSRTGTIRSFTNMISSKVRHREEGNFTLGCLKLFHTRTRFLVMVNLLLCLASVWSNILAFNFALVCFNKPDNETDGAEPIDNPQPTFFTPEDRSYLTSIVAATALVANFIVVQLVNRFGIRVLFTLLGLLSAVSTYLLPWAIFNGYYATLVMRGLQGIAFSANFPVIGAFTSKWTYYKQNGLFVSVLVAYVQLSPAITMPISGALCESSMGWPSVFYFHAGATVLLFIFFALFYRNSPKKHPLVGETELAKIQMGKSEMSKAALRNIPYLDILRTPSVWAVWMAAIGNFVCVNMMFLYSPSFMSNVLHMPVHSTGISSALPPLAQFTIKLLSGFTSDKLRCVSETNKLRLYNSVAFFGSALLMAVLAFWPKEQTNVKLLLFGASAGLLGCTTGGFFKAGPMVSKQFSHFVTGNISQGITITMLIVPFMVNGLAPNSTAEQWTSVFLVTSAVLAITNVLFILMVSAEPASWTVSLDQRSTDNDMTKNNTRSS